MLRVPINQARPGMVLAMHLAHPERPGTVLLKTGVTLDAQLIGRLREIRCPDCWIEYPGLGFIADYVSPQIIEDHQQLTASIGESFDRALDNAHAKLDFHGYKRGVSALLESLRKHPKAALYLNEMNATLPPLMRHSSTVCLLSLLCGLRLDFYLVRERSRLAANVAQDVSNLGVAALLHDVGVLRLDEEVRERFEAERDEDDPDWRQHVIHGYEMVRGEIDPTAASAVLHHHQRFDGSGFPKMRSVGGEYRTLMGSGIHVFARIIAACEEFSRKRFESDQPRPVVGVLNEMLYGDRKDFFDPVVMTALTNVAPPYGPGSIVRLSSGMPAVVTDWSPSDPCRPEVMPMAELDETHEFDPIECEHRPRIDLRESEHLEIAEIDGVSVLEDNFYPGEGEQFDLAALNKRMDNRADEFERRAG